MARVRRLLGHFASLGRFIAQHERRATADSAALAELSREAARTLALPGGLELEWLGTAGYRMSFEQRTLYLDPYVSRVSLGHVLRGRRAVADRAMIERWLRPVGEVLGVLVGHTHFDHAIDVPVLCERHGCPAYGSRSLANLMALYRQSGLTQRAFARQHGIKLGTLQQWLCRLKTQPASARPRFQELIVPLSSSKWAAEIRLSQEITIQLDTQATEQLITQLLGNLRRPC